MEDTDESEPALNENDNSTQETIVPYTLDTLLEDLGQCGRFQIAFFSLGYFPILPAAWGLMFMMFGSYNPGWNCQDELILTTFLEYSTNQSTSTTQDSRSISANRTPVSSCDTLRLCENVTFNDVASTIVTEWSLVCDDSWIPPLIISVQMVGVTLGAIVGGHMGDKLGRKYSIHGCSALLALTNIVAIFSVSWEMYTVVRFFIGFASGSILSTVVVYTLEFIPLRWRGYLGTFPFWNVATFSLGLCVMALKNWKHIHIATAIASLMAFLPVFWLPESFRFLTVQRKIKRANKIVQKISRINRRPTPDTTIINTVAEAEREIMKSRTSYTFLDLFHRKLRRNTFALGLIWLTLSVGYFIIGFGIKALYGDFFVNFLLFTSISFPSRIICLILAMKVGRKFACSTFVSASSLCAFIVVGIQLLASEETKGTPTFVLTLLLGMMLEGAWGVVVLMVVELSPTGVRNSSYGYCNFMGRIGAIIAPYLLSKDTLPLFGTFLIVGILQIICVFALLALPESKDRPLQDNFIMKMTKSKNQIQAHKL